MDVQKNEVYPKEIMHHTASLSQLVGRFLGLSPSLFIHYRDPETDQPRGARKIEIRCGNTKAKQEMMLSNVIQERFSRNGEPFFEISTPTVKQVVRNHFDCQTMTGAKLDAPVPNPKKVDECTFFNLDLRYHFDEDMTSISQNEDSAFGVSSLSLALLEDSSWYKANFAAAKTPAFGRGAGCGFVEGSCIAGGKVPDYSAGFFCSSKERPGARSGCDFSHHNKAGCDAETVNSEIGSPFADVRHCPMRSKHLVSCSSNGKAVAAIAGESFEENSRCFETDAMIPVCLQTVCNASDKTLSIVVKGKTFHCSHHGQLINVDTGYSVVCPRLAAVCPDLVCPSNCSGKGLCDYCKEIPECICDNPLDSSDGCWES
jgi:leishmanolysin-like peptidase